jgi:hypothetical protein
MFLGSIVKMWVRPRLRIENVQAVLATQFKDFELGSVRQISMHPLLGTGIVSHMLAFCTCSSSNSN